jgi:hypothetical protein
MHMSGWQRLWLFASILWTVVVVWLSGILQFDGDHTVPSANMILFVVRLWIGPVVAVYAMGVGVAWVRRGFQIASEQPITRGGWFLSTGSGPPGRLAPRSILSLHIRPKSAIRFWGLSGHR